MKVQKNESILQGDDFVQISDGLSVKMQNLNGFLTEKTKVWQL